MCLCSAFEGLKTGIGDFADNVLIREAVPDPDSRATWKWGPNGHGAILLVNCDKETDSTPKPDNEDRYLQGAADLQDMSPMLVRTRGPAKLPPGYSLQLHTLESQHAGVFHVPDLSKVIGTESHSLGPGKSSYLFEYPGRGGEVKLFVEGLSFPDGDFNGFVLFHLSLLQSILPGKQSTPIFTDSVVFRVAPWIMTPNTQPALEVFMSRVDSNAVFIKQMTTLAHLAGCTPIEIQVNMDVWMQVSVSV
ncbi:protein-arginine deiminase type-3-like [Petromyzon marinus]|uniref:protein-arginine deiminase type-3-like n=1 Tax=Petromyzon marinus TaxID=7757 RepID=UPI003F6F59C1